MNELEAKIRNNLPNDAIVVQNILLNNGFNVYFVGGALRDIADSLIHDSPRVIKDWDLTANAKYEDMYKIFNKLLRVREHGRVVNKSGRVELLIPRLGTVAVYIGKSMFEVTPMSTFMNKELVFVNDIYEDLSKRDFTINAMAFNCRDGLICDITLGDGKRMNPLDDIKNKVIRSVDNPGIAFQRNYYSMFRALLLANRLGYDIESVTYKAICENICGMEFINKGKLFKGFQALLVSDDFEKVYYLINSGILSVLNAGWRSIFNKDLECIFNNMGRINRDFNERIVFLVKGLLAAGVDGSNVKGLLSGFGVANEKIEVIFNCIDKETM